jgi:hypothetical protein
MKMINQNTDFCYALSTDKMVAAVWQIIVSALYDRLKKKTQKHSSDTWLKVIWTEIY